MADNVVLSAAVGTGDTVAADDVSGVKYQLVQLVTGTDGGAKSLVTGPTGLPITDASGSITVDNGGTFAVQAAQSGTWTVTGAGGTFPVTDSGGSLTIDNAALSVTGGGVEASALRVTIASDSTGVLSIDDNGGSVTVDGTVAVSGTVTIAGAVTNAGTFAVQTGAERAEDAAHSTGHTGLFVLAVRSDTAAQTAGTDGDYCGLICDSTGRLHVNVGNSVAVTTATPWSTNLAQYAGSTVGASNAVHVQPGTSAAFPVTDNSGSLTVDAPVGTPVFVRLSDGSSAIATLPVQGAAAHDAAVSGSPVLSGAEARSSEGTAVTSGDAVRLIADLVGKLVTLPYTVPENMLSGTASSTGTGDTEVIAAQGAGVRIYVTALVVHNTSATDTYVTIKSATTARMVVPAPTKGGAVIPLPVPLRLTANEALNFASASGVTTMHVSAIAYKGA